MQNKKFKQAIFATILVLVSTTLALALGEAVLRIKNSSMKNYDIEMWRYALLLKQKSEIPSLGHDHIPNKSAVLQSVNIRINEHGLRGAPVPPIKEGQRRILFLGSSMTLGWGVPENETLTERLQQRFDPERKNTIILNAGIGNYNAPRYVERFKRYLTDLQPTDIVVHYFLRDAEVLEAGGGNALLRNSQLAVTMWIAGSRFFGKSSQKSLVDHYRDVYVPGTKGFDDMRKALHELALYGKEHNVRIYLAMTPDVHDLVNYPFQDIHGMMHKVANEEGFIFVDLLDSMRNLTPEKLWSMPGDPHPNGLGHKLMADALYPVLSQGMAGKTAALK